MSAAVIRRQADAGRDESKGSPGGSDGQRWCTTQARAGFGPYEFSLGDELRGERATLGKTLLDIQRDLRIKAAYIAAIEDAKPEVFPNPSFIAGYVRSYARYLGMDPDEVFQRFCRESGFTGKAGGRRRLGGQAGRAAEAPAASGDFARRSRRSTAACRRSRSRRSARSWCSSA